MYRDPFKEYIRQTEPDKRDKGYAWHTAIGPQAVDGLKTSQYLIDTAIKNLSPREGKIMCLRFGLDGEEEKTQKEVAELLGISQSYISRLEKRIISRLKSDFHRMTK